MQRCLMNERNTLLSFFKDLNIEALADAEFETLSPQCPFSAGYKSDF